MSFILLNPYWICRQTWRWNNKLGETFPILLNILSLNSQSLNAKFDEHKILLEIAHIQNIQFHVINLYSRWLFWTVKVNVNTQYFIPDYDSCIFDTRVR